MGVKKVEIEVKPSADPGVKTSTGMGVQVAGMGVQTTDIEGLVLLKPRVFEDPRGYFFESYSEERYDALLGRRVRFVQDNESRSPRGVLRGLHYQKGDKAQAKLVRVMEGKVWDVAVDLRPESETFGRHFGVELTGENRLQLFIPRGFAHGFVVLSDHALFGYKCDNYYAPEAEAGILWNDPDLAIPWPLAPDEVILSAKDLRHPTFEQFIRTLSSQK